MILRSCGLMALALNEVDNTVSSISKNVLFNLELSITAFLFMVVMVMRDYLGCQVYARSDRMGE